MHRKVVHLLLGSFICGALTANLSSQQPATQAGLASLNSTSISAQFASGSQGNEVTIGSWYFLGPYSDSSGVQPGGGDAHPGALDSDYLSTAGHPEAQLDVDALTALCKSANSCTPYSSTGPIINLLRLFSGKPHSILYAAAVLDSPADTHVGLQYDISFGTKIWVNGHPVDEYRATTRHPVSMYIHFAPLSLKKGKNLLVIKTNQEGFGPVFEPWMLAASLMPIQRMWDFVLSTQDGFLLANRLLKPGDPIHIPLLDTPMMLDRTMPITVSISMHGESISKKAIGPENAGIISTPKLDPGVYKVRLDVGGHDIDDAFYIGDPSTIHDQLKGVQGKADEKSDEYLQRAAIIKRFEVLTSAQYQHPEDPNWQKKLMMVIEEAQESIGDQTKVPWYMQPGQHLREYVSAADKSRQNYLLDIPEAATRPMGLIIIVPYAVSKQRLFLESAFISYSTVLEQVRQASEQSKIAVAIIGAREPSGGSALDEEDALNVLKDISTHYSIDPKRVYLYGVCEGGRNALLLAEHHPGIFAAVGAWGPTLAASRDGSDDPVMLAKEIAKTPVVLFKGDLDYELPNQALLAFGRILKSLGNQEVTVQIVPNAMHDPIRMESVIFPLLAGFKNERSDASVNSLPADAINQFSH